MRTFRALLHRELASAFLRPSHYVMTAVFVLLYSLMFVGSVQGTQMALFEDIALTVAFLSVLLVPLITMRSFAEETGSGTMELLLTAPVRPVAVVLAKFVGVFAYFLATLSPCLVYVWLLGSFGDIDRGVVLTSLIGLVLLGATYVSVGLFTSSLTDNQVVAAALSFVAILSLLLLHYVFGTGSGGWTEALRYVSFTGHFKQTFCQGLIDTRSLVYFLTMPTAMLVLTWLVVHERDLFARLRGGENRRWSLAAGVTFFGSFVLFLAGAGWLHVRYGHARLGETLQVQGYGILAIPLGFALAGAALLATAFYCRVRSRPAARPFDSVRAFFNKRNAPTLAGAVAVLLILLNVNYLHTLPMDRAGDWPVLGPVARAIRWHRWDLTEYGVNSLSTVTKETLDQLDEPLYITVFYTDDPESYQGVALLEQVKRLLSEFTSHINRVHVTYIDSRLQQDQALEKAKEFGLNIRHLPRAAVMEYHGRRLVVPAEMLLKQPGWKARAAKIDTPTFNGEEGFVRGIKRLIDPYTPRVYFTTGKGELSQQTRRRNDNTTGLFANALRREAYEVKTITLRGQPIPNDCSVLVMAGPRVPLQENVIRSLVDFVDVRGGRVLVLLPSIQFAEAGDGWKRLPARDLLFDQLLQSWGGVPRRDNVLDTRLNYRGQSSNLVAIATEDHPVVAGQERLKVVLPVAQSLRTEHKPGRGWQTWRLLLSGPDSTIRQSVDAAGRLQRGKGQAVLAFAAASPATPQKPESRVVVVGNAKCVSNPYWEVGGNETFFLRAVRWLAGRDYRVDIAQRHYADRSFSLTGEQTRLLYWVALVALPLAWFLVGGLVWWVRKQ